VSRLGGYRLREISPGMVQTFLRELTKEQVGDASINKAAAVLSGIFRRAIVDGYVERNPVASVKKPAQKRKREPEIIAPITVEKIREKLGLRDATLVSLLAYGGLRPESEAITLTWEQIGEQTIRIDATKTHKTRYVRLLAPLAEDLAEYRKTMEPIGLVFPKRKGKAWTRDDWKNFERRIWKRVGREVGLRQDTRARDLRGSFASLLIWEGMNVVEVADQRGHSAQTCLKDYAGVFAEFKPSERKSAEEAIYKARMCPKSVLADGDLSKNRDPTPGLEPGTPSLRVKCSTN